MHRPKNRQPNDDAEFDLDDEAFVESFLKGLDKLAEEAGDWRIHLPYEAILGYRSNKAIQEQFEDHYNACAYCQELMDTLCPGD